MSNYIYEKVEGMTVGDVVQAMIAGSGFYRHSKYRVEINTAIRGIFIQKNIVIMDFASLRMELEAGTIYTCRVAAWWEGCEGGFIMVRDHAKHSWRPDVLNNYRSGAKYPFVCKFNTWKYARPFTAAERDAIKVEG